MQQHGVAAMHPPADEPGSMPAVLAGPSAAHEAGVQQMNSLQYEIGSLSGICQELLSCSGERDQQIESLSTLLRDIKHMQGPSSPQVNTACTRPC